MNPAPSVRRDRVDIIGATVLISFNMLLGLNQALVKLVNAGFSPVFQSGLRSLCAFFVVLAAAIWLKRRLSISDGSLMPGLASGVLFSLEFCLLFTALDYTSVSRVSVLFYTQPFFVVLAAHFLLPGESLNKARVIGLTLALGGVMILLLTDTPAEGSTAIGDIMCLLAAMTWAAIVLLVRKSRLAQCTPEMQLLYQLAVSAVLLTAIAPLFGDVIRVLTPQILAIFAFQVVIVVAFGFLLWFWALSVYPASDMSTYALLAPLFGVFFGWAIFDEELGYLFGLSLTCVCLGLVIISWPGARR